MYNNLSHIALILDGNKRWAKNNHLPIIDGYKKGFANIKNIVEYSLYKKISYLTLFTLSSENYNRSTIDILYEILHFKLVINILHSLQPSLYVMNKIINSTICI